MDPILEAINESRIVTSPDVLEVFHILFSSLGQPDEYLVPLLANKTQDQQIKYIVIDILKLAENGRRDSHYREVDGYWIWFVAYYDSPEVNMLA